MLWGLCSGCNDRVLALLALGLYNLTPSDTTRAMNHFRATEAKEDVTVPSARRRKETGKLDGHQYCKDISVG